MQQAIQTFDSINQSEYFDKGCQVLFKILFKEQSQHIKKLQKDLSKLEKDVSKLEKDVGELRNEVGALTNKVDKLDDKLANIKSTIEDQYGSLRRDIFNTTNMAVQQSYMFDKTIQTTKHVQQLMHDSCSQQSSTIGQYAQCIDKYKTQL